MFRLSTLTLVCLVLANSVSAAPPAKTAKKLTAPTEKQAIVLIENYLRKKGLRNGKVTKFYGIESSIGAKFYHDDIANGSGGWLSYPDGSRNGVWDSEWGVKVDVESDLGFGEKHKATVIYLLADSKVLTGIDPSHFRVGRPGS